MATPVVAPPRRGRALRPLAAIATMGAVVAGAVIVSGYDSQDVPQLETAVWVTRSDGQYARVNTELGELDTVRAVADPVDIVQAGSQSLIFSQGYSQAWPVDPAYPVDLVEGETGSGGATPSPTPAGTDYVTTAGSYVAYLTALGDVYLSAYPAPGATQTGAWKLDPFAGLDVLEDEEPPRYNATAVAMDADGNVAMYSAVESGVRMYDASRAAFVGEVQLVPSAPEPGELAMSMVDGRWVLFSSADGLLWAQGRETPIATGVDGDGLLQAGDSQGRVLIADAQGLVAVSISDGGVDRIAEASGTPAAPVVVAGISYAAWLSQTRATLWTSDTGAVEDLTLPTGELDEVQTLVPVFRSNGDRAVLSELATGLIWTLPTGALVPVEEWEPLDDGDELEGTVEMADVVEQEPPVAVADVFGVRRGAVTSLPLLFNDHDPNQKDALTIDPESMSAFGDESFGSLGLIDNDQAAVVQVAADAGSATFSYSATDGLGTSTPATVTLNVVPADQNTAPEWCGVEGCVQEWPAPQVVPGGFVKVPVMTGWVDPEGDTIALVNAVAQDLNAPITVVPTADGTVAVRHLDPNAGEVILTIDVTVSDSLGAMSTKELEIRVTAAPALDAPPIVVSAGVDDSRVVAIADFVTGGSGSYKLVDAVATHGNDGFTVTPILSSGTVELSAKAPGKYVATYTVEDTQTLAQQTATLRLTVADVNRGLSMPPLTAFVRPQEDATLDILATAQNNTGRVLLISAATSSEPNLSFSVVGNTYLRLSGTTADGQPGRVGVVDVTVSDGAGASATTQVTVFMLAPSQGTRPIAVPDTLTVRAGSQVDLAVLDNDISPRGERLLLHPDVEGSEAEGELAFASGVLLRYLAPEVPGVYTLRYTTYLENAPSKFDAATVSVTVLPAGSNRAPEPPALVGRVLAGQSVSIPFPSAGIDPDGDDVTLVDVSQPGAGDGVASLAPSGRAVVYRAPTDGVQGGQVEFTYTVRDSYGDIGEATVRVGVLDSKLGDPQPITYSDYVAMQVGSQAPVTVAPLGNDHDPLRGTLRLLDLVPSALPDSAEYDRLAALIDDETSLDEGRVVLRAGDQLGTHSYVYTVEASSNLSTSKGLIVVGVADEAGPSHLTVADTTLTARTRYDLEQGVDVVTGKVQWPTGDPATLKMAIWGDTPAEYNESGWAITGPLPDERTVIPFTLTGTDFAGNEVQTFGFLRVPAFEDMRLQVKSGLTPTEVGEEQTVELPIREALDIGAADVIEIRQDDSFAVQRDNARCVPAGADAASYAAGREAPWTDTCSVAVRLQGQEAWSIVALPLVIGPKSPQAILSPVSHEVSPGDTKTIALVAEMISWEGGRVGDVGDLDLRIAYGGNAFVVTEVGGQVTVLTKAGSVPGTRERIEVSSAAYGGLTSTINLTVGIAFPDAPRGATFKHQCDVSRGSTCTINAIGLGGEYDPFAGIVDGGLEVAMVGTTGTVSCPVATVTKASATSLVASWPAGPRPVGGECVVPFTVVDAQGRTGPGQVTLDVLGYPQTPASVTTVAYTGTSVTLQVALGPASDAHPDVTTVAIYSGGNPVPAACTLSGPGTYRCLVVGLENGTKALYTARAVNSVGESLDTTTHETWAYQPPLATVSDATAVYVPGTTNQGTGAVTVSVTSSDDTQSFTVINTGLQVTRTGLVTTFTIGVPVGPQQIQVTPISKFTPPIDGANVGTTANRPVTAVGSPFYTGSADASADSDSITLTGPSLNSNYSSEPSSQVWVAWVQGGSVPTCTMNGSGQAQVSGGGTWTSTTNTIEGLNPNTNYSAAVCGSNEFGAALSGFDSDFTWAAPAAPGGNTTYTINPNYSYSGGAREYTYGVLTAPALTPLAGFTVYYSYNGGAKTTTFDPGFNSGVDITAVYCFTVTPHLCGDPVDIEPTATSPYSKVRVAFVHNPGCYEEGEASINELTVWGASRGTDAVLVEPIGDQYHVLWPTARYNSLQEIVRDINLCQPPDPDPEEEEDP